jgi:hypothetical protein
MKMAKINEMRKSKISMAKLLAASHEMKANGVIDINGVTKAKWRKWRK